MVSAPNRLNCLPSAPVLQGYQKSGLRSGVHFGNPEAPPVADATSPDQVILSSSTSKKVPPAADSLSAKLGRAGNSLKNNLTSGRWWLNQGLISGAITLATCWLPGSQLVTIPVWLAASLAGDAVIAMFDPNADQARQQSKPLPLPRSDETTGNKLKGSLYGLGKGLWRGLVDHPIQNLMISGAICLATCWLPGSQLILIPAFFAMNSAYRGVKEAIAGYKNPQLYLSKAASPNQAQPESASK